VYGVALLCGENMATYRLGQQQYDARVLSCPHNSCSAHRRPAIRRPHQNESGYRATGNTENLVTGRAASVTDFRYVAVVLTEINSFEITRVEMTSKSVVNTLFLPLYR